MSPRYLFKRASIRCLVATPFVMAAALQTGCTLFPGLCCDQEIQAAVEKAADDPFPSAKQVGLAAKEDG
jgi:hypothetical protein